MTKFLANIYKRDLMQKQQRYERLTDTFDGPSPKNSQRTIPVHTKVLVSFPQPPGTSAKLYNQWKGIFIVIKQIDKNSYLIGPLEGKRRKFLVHRSRIREIPAGDHQGDESSERNHGNTAEKNDDPAQCEQTGGEKLLIPDDTVDLAQKPGAAGDKKSKSTKKTGVPKVRTHAMATRSKQNKDSNNNPTT